MIPRAVDLRPYQSPPVRAPRPVRARLERALDDAIDARDRAAGWGDDAAAEHYERRACRLEARLVRLCAQDVTRD